MKTVATAVMLAVGGATANAQTISDQLPPPSSITVRQTALDSVVERLPWEGCRSPGLLVQRARPLGAAAVSGPIW